MYETVAPARLTSDEALRAYTSFLGNLGLFEYALNRVISEWPISCEQFLSNPSINRIAWLGQASMCVASGVPARFRAGFAALEIPEQSAANALANSFLSMWLVCNTVNEQPVELPAPKGLRPRIAHYIETWQGRGYEAGIPDEVPSELMRLNLAPSHKAVALAVLKNDHALSSLGYSQPVSPWYGVIKREELRVRNSL